MNTAGPGGAPWRKSTFSGSADQSCVEVATNVTGSVAVRHSKDAVGAQLVFSLPEWVAFVRGVRAGEFDLDSTL